MILWATYGEIQERQVVLYQYDLIVFVFISLHFSFPLFHFSFFHDQ